MIGRAFKLFMIVGFVALIGWAFMKNEQNIERIAKEHGFDAERTAAFRACDGDMSDKTLSMGDITYGNVPDDICICQSQAMVAVFRSGEYAGHGNVVDYLTDEGERRPLNPEHLRKPADPDGQFTRLADSLMQCAYIFSLEEERRTREAVQRARGGQGG